MSEIVNENVNVNEKLVITIMAAGEGKRMNSDIPKVLHHFKGIPMLIRIILESLKINPSKIIIITGKYDELIKSTVFTYFNNDKNNKYNKNNNDCINKLTFVKQVIPNGTGDAIKSVLGYYNDDEKVLILNGDMPLIKSDLLRKFIDFESNLLIAQLDNPFGYGRIIKDENNKFIAIREQKDCNTEEKEIKEVNVGIYLFNGNILKKYIPMIENNNAQKEYYLTDIIEILRTNENQMEIKTYLINRDDTYMICGVNTKEELEELEKKIV